MSADNWADCPRCEKRHAEELVKRGEALSAMYGTVEPEKYTAAVASLDAFRRSGPHRQTLREDYQIGVRNGQFCVAYEASCYTDDCGFSLAYQHEQTAPA